MRLKVTGGGKVKDTVVMVRAVTLATQEIKAGGSSS